MASCRSVTVRSAASACSGPAPAGRVTASVMVNSGCPGLSWAVNQTRSWAYEAGTV